VSLNVPSSKSIYIIKDNILYYIMYRFILGTLVGIYLEQTYHLPNVYDKFREFDKYLKERKKD